MLCFRIKTCLFNVFIFGDSSKAIIEGESYKFTWTDAHQHAQEYRLSVFITDYYFYWDLHQLLLDVIKELPD